MRIGIIGGIGTVAGINAVNWLIAHRTLNTVKSDADYPAFTLHNVPVPYTDKDGVRDSRVRDLIIKELELLNGFCDKIIIACISLHKWFEEFNSICNKKLVNLIDATIAQCKAGEAVAVLCSQSAQDDQLFDGPAFKKKIKIIYPDASARKLVDAAIESAITRANIQSAHSMIRPVVMDLYHATHHPVVLGCTDISVTPIASISLGRYIIDPIEVVTRQIITDLLDKEKKGQANE